MQLQHTLSRPFTLCGKGLHSGKAATLTLRPAPPDTGTVFRRVDLGPDAVVPSLARYVSSTGRSTSLEKDGVVVRTVEHLLSALTGMGVDNAVVDLEGEEVPILDGCSAIFCDSIAEAGLCVQDRQRRYVDVSTPLEVRDDSTGAWARVSPTHGGEVSYCCRVDYDSKVLTAATVRWDPGISYREELSPCRTFVFFHELEPLLEAGLIRGGDLDSAVVIFEAPVGRRQLDLLAARMGFSSVGVGTDGYPEGVSPRFPDECARHKMLDLLGDLRLCGGFLRGRVEAYKPGHRINTLLAQRILQSTGDIHDSTNTTKP